MTQLVQRQSRRRRHRSRNGFLIALGVLAATLVLALLSLVGYVLAVASSGPELSHLKPVDKDETSVIFESEGHRLGYVQSDDIRTTVT